MANVQSVDESNFQQEVLESTIPVLVDFWAPWCGYCTKLAPVFEELADSMGSQVKLVKLNVDENRGIAQKLGIMSLPTMALFKNGEVVDKLMGFMPKAAIEYKIKPLL